MFIKFKSLGATYDLQAVSQNIDTQEPIVNIYVNPKYIIAITELKKHKPYCLMHICGSDNSRFIIKGSADQTRALIDGGKASKILYEEA